MLDDIHDNSAGVQPGETSDVFFITYAPDIAPGQEIQWGYVTYDLEMATVMLVPEPGLAVMWGTALASLWMLSVPQMRRRRDAIHTEARITQAT